MDFDTFARAAGGVSPDFQKKLDEFKAGVETYGEISKEDNLALSQALADDLVSTDNGLTPVQAVAVAIGTALVISQRDETGASTAILMKSLEIALIKLIEKTAKDAGLPADFFKQITAQRIAA
jgi:hypothetical protein